MATSKIIGFRIPDDIQGKAKYIAWFERQTLTDRVIELISSDIKKWENENGQITPDMIAKSVKK